MLRWGYVCSWLFFFNFSLLFCFVVVTVLTTSETPCGWRTGGRGNKGNAISSNDSEWYSFTSSILRIFSNNEKVVAQESETCKLKCLNGLNTFTFSNSTLFGIEPDTKNRETMQQPQSHILSIIFRKIIAVINIFLVTITDLLKYRCYNCPPIGKPIYLINYLQNPKVRDQISATSQTPKNFN